MTPKATSDSNFLQTEHNTADSMMALLRYHLNWKQGKQAQEGHLQVSPLAQQRKGLTGGSLDARPGGGE